MGRGSSASLAASHGGMLYGRSSRAVKANPRTDFSEQILAESVWTAEHSQREQAADLLASKIRFASPSEREAVAARLADLVNAHKPLSQQQTFEGQPLSVSVEQMSQRHCLILGRAIILGLASERLVEAYGQCAHHFKMIFGRGPEIAYIIDAARQYQWTDERVSIDLAEAKGFGSDELTYQVRARFTTLLRNQFMLVKNDHEPEMLDIIATERVRAGLDVADGNDKDWIRAFNEFIQRSVDGARVDHLLEVLFARLG
jgi:hypothetical protein